jgi:hypothetical protein
LAGEVTIELGASCWLATVRCHEEGLMFTLPIPACLEALQEIERALCSGRVPWREFDSWKTREKRKEAERKKVDKKPAAGQNQRTKGS